MKLSFAAALLLKHVLSTDGTKETDKNGEEVFAARRLNGVESAQRRFYFKAIEPFEKESTEAITTLVKEHNAKIDVVRKELKETTPKQEGEEDNAYTMRIEMLVNKDTGLVESRKAVNEKMGAQGDEVREIEVRPETLKVLKKYFEEFGEKVGYVMQDDNAVDQLTETFKAVV